MIRRLLFMVSFVVLVVVNSSQAEVKTGKSQTVYVSAYSHVYSGDRALPFNLAVTLVIRNTDPKSSINVTSVDYFDDKGKLVRHMIDSPLRVVPMASTSFFISVRLRPVAGSGLPAPGLAAAEPPPGSQSPGQLKSTVLSP